MKVTQLYCKNTGPRTLLPEEFKCQRWQTQEHDRLSHGARTDAHKGGLLG